MMSAIFRNWYYAVRPWTLPAAIAPVIAGSCFAFGDGKGQWLASIAAMLVAIFIQIGTNFVNDIADFRKGADAHNRIGPVRVIQSGLIQERTLVYASIGAFLAAAAIGLSIVAFQKAWVLIPIGAACICAGIFYTAGPKPVAYIGLGDIFVLIFFGPVAFCGTYYIQAGTITAASILGGLGCGLICTGILIVNNYRDYESDKAVDKKTLPVRFGRSFAQWEYLVVMLAACFIPIVIAIGSAHIGVLFACGLIIPMSHLVRTVFSTTDGDVLNKTLASTGKILFLYSVVMGAGWIVF